MDNFQKVADEMMKLLTGPIGAPMMILVIVALIFIVRGTPGSR